MKLFFTTLFLCLCLQAFCQEIFVTNTNSQLYTVNVLACTQKLVGTTGHGFGDIAITPDGRLWGIESGELYQIDTTTAAATLVGTTGTQAVSLVDLDDSTLLVEDGMKLYGIKTKDASSYLIGNIGYQASGDLTWYDKNLYMTAGDLLIKITLDSVNASVVSSAPVNNEQSSLPTCEALVTASFPCSANALVGFSGPDAYKICQIDGSYQLLCSGLVYAGTPGAACLRLALQNPEPITCQSSTVTFQTTVTNASCTGANDGTATVVPSGCGNPYTYMWNTSPVQTTQTATGLQAGSYTVTITNVYAASITQTVTITQSVAAKRTISTVRDTICQGTQCSLVVSDTTGSLQWQSATSQSNLTSISGATNGHYKQVLNQSTYFRTVASNGACADTSNTLEIYVPPVLTASFKYTKTGNHEVTFNSDSSVGDIISYYWEFNDHQTSIEKNPVHTFAKDSAYNVCLTVYDGSNCSYTFCRVLDLADAISSVAGQSNWIIYPNPFNDYLSVNNNSGNEKIESIVVYDVLGRNVFSLFPAKQRESFQIDMSGFANGMYYIKISTTKLNYVAPVVKSTP